MYTPRDTAELIKQAATIQARERRKEAARRNQETNTWQPRGGGRIDREDFFNEARRGAPWVNETPKEATPEEAATWIARRADQKAGDRRDRSDWEEARDEAKEKVNEGREFYPARYPGDDAVRYNEETGEQHDEDEHDELIDRYRAVQLQRTETADHTGV